MAHVRIKDTLWKRVMNAVRTVERRFGGEGEGGPRPIDAPPVSMRVQSVQDDYLTCRTWLGDVLGTTDIKVSKPEEMRKAPFSPTNTTGDGKTYTYTNGFTRTVTQGATTENQIIIPAYRLPSGAYKGSLILAQPAVSGGTSLVLNAGLPNEERVVFIDLNIDGRAWAKV